MIEKIILFLVALTASAYVMTKSGRSQYLLVAVGAAFAYSYLYGRDVLALLAWFAIAGATFVAVLARR